MQLKDVMTPNAEALPPDATIGDAAKKMRDLDVCALPICDGDRLYGMITDRDIVTRAVAEGQYGHGPVRNLMTEEVLCCFEDQEYEEAAALMRKHKVRCLAVLSRKKRLVVFVSLGDVSLTVDDDSATTSSL